MIRASIRRPVAVAMAYLAVALLGVAAWRNLPIELLPDTELPRLNVRAQWPGASPQTTEALLTAPLEAAVQQVRGVERITSESTDQYGAGSADIDVEFARGTDMDFARLELSERLAALEDELPPAAFRPRIADYLPRELQSQRRPFLAYTVTGPFTLEALRAYVDEQVAPALRQVDGVGGGGGAGRPRPAAGDRAGPRAHRRAGPHPRDGARAAAGAGDRPTRRGGWRWAGRSTRWRCATGRRARPRCGDCRCSPIAAGCCGWRRWPRCATPTSPPRSHYRIDGQPAVSFTVHRQVGSNAVAVADRVKARLATLETSAPPGVRLLLDSDESAAVRAQLADLRTRALVAAAVVFLVLLVFLRSWRSAGIVFASIAFSVLITLNLLYWAGYSLNVLTLMGLALGFGLIVDNSIVVLENVYRQRRRGEPAPEAAERGAREVVLPVLAATLTTLVVMIPFVYLQGELKVFYVPLALVVGFSLLASLAVAFSFIPALGGRILGSLREEGATGNAQTRRPPVYVRGFAALTGWTLRHPWTTVALALGLLGGSGYLFDKYVTRGVVWGRWGMDQTYLDVQISLPRGEEIERTDELVRYFEARLKAMPEVARYTTWVQPQYASIRVTFPDSLERSWVPVAIKEQMVAFSHGFGGAEVRVYGFGPSFYGGGSTAPNYSLEVRGYNYEAVRAIAEDLGRRLRRFARIPEVDTNASAGWYRGDRATELVLRLDRARLATHGLSARDVVERVRAAVAAGEGHGSVLSLGGEEVQLAVKLAGHESLDALALQELLLPAPGGAGVRLGEVATLEERQVQAHIRRENQQYQRTVAYEFRGPYKLGNRVRDAVVAATRLPPGYSIEKDRGWFWSTEEKEQIYGVLAVSLLLVFMVTAALFESLRQPLVVLLSVPMALVGVFLVFFATGASFTREAYIGVIMMGGIVVNNAILLVDHVNALWRAGGLDLREAILRGTLERVRPILMTSATTVLGILPLVLFSDHADQNIWNALGYALIGGLTSSTLLVLTVTPALYRLIGARTSPRNQSSGYSSGQVVGEQSWRDMGNHSGFSGELSS